MVSRSPEAGRGDAARRRRAIVVLALAALVLAGAFVAVRAYVLEGPEDAVEGFLAEWSDGRDRRAAEATDSPRAAATALRENRAGLDGASLTAEAEAEEIEEGGDRATASVRLRWDVPAFGELAYRVRVPLVREEGDWKVRWTPAVVHPRLDGETRLGTTRLFGERAPILGRGGRPLVLDRPVVRVGAIAGEVKSPRATAEGLADALDVDAGPLLRQIRGGGPEQFVEAVVLRVEDFEDVRAAVEAVPDATTVDDQAPLAPTREFARALLGSVAPATREQLDRLGAPYVAGDDVGQWGLQARFERRLAGDPTRRVVVRARGIPIETLRERPGRAGRPLRTTLDPQVQQAAESALADRSDEAALVAIDARAGDVLAVANRPVDSTFDRALEGSYPPGSTFKVVSTAALLRDGLSVGETVDCPATIDVDGRQFRNFEGGAAGAVPFSTDFAQSCNTAFVSLAPRLPAAALRRTGRDFGLGREPRLPLPVAPSQVPPGRTPVERAAAMIGQHEILASPLAMAGVAGTVAAGRWRAPRLIAGAPAASGPPLAADELGALRTLMRSVVTSGTGTALAGVAGAPAGKSGTAEYGGGDPPPTHAWFIAYRDDLALAVLVENGRSGGSVAAPIAARFFAALDG